MVLALLLVLKRKTVKWGQIEFLNINHQITDLTVLFHTERCNEFVLYIHAHSHLLHWLHFKIDPCLEPAGRSIIKSFITIYSSNITTALLPNKTQPLNQCIWYYYFILQTFYCTTSLQLSGDLSEPIRRVGYGGEGQCEKGSFSRKFIGSSKNTDWRNVWLCLKIMKIYVDF